MSYFLRTLPNPLEADAFALVQDEQQLFEWIRAEHGRLLARASRQRFGNAALLEMPSTTASSPRDDDDVVLNARDEHGEAEEESKEADLAAMFASLDVAATPSSLGANALAQAMVYRLTNCCGLTTNRAAALCCDDRWPEHWLLAQLGQQCAAATSGDHSSVGGHFLLQSNMNNAHSGSVAPELVSMGLDCVFSVLLELNQRDPELCAQSLQSLLQLLAHMEPESLARQPRPMTGRMHQMLRELRREGNASVSASANACMMSLAVASGQPEFLFATISALICEPKRHLPHNRQQLSADSNPLPRNVQLLVQASQRLILGQQGPSGLELPLERRAPVCEFDVIYTGSAVLNIQTESAAGTKVQGCLVSDGAYVYLLSQFGLLKMGTGLSETRAGEVVTCNEMLRFSEGSALFVSNESLYLRRRHSSRLWVLDTDSLREIGEIMLPSALTSQGQLFADGRQFWHAQLDEQWHLVCSPLDDSFAPLLEQSPTSNGTGGPVERRQQTMAAGTSRLMETEFCAFGELQDQQQRLLQSIPAQLRGVAADLQLASNAAFLLSRCGRLFYAGPDCAAQFGLDLRSSDPFQWSRLPLPEPAVAMALEESNKTLVIRSGAGNLWLLCARTKSPAKSPKKSAESAAAAVRGAFRRLKVPNKRKCVSLSAVSVGGGCLAYATENGRCFLLGRHVLNSGGLHQLPPLAQCSPAKQTPLPVAGLENLQVAQLALGKTHLVVVAKNGAVYATGLNNQNQCGRPVVEEQPHSPKPPRHIVCDGSSTHLSASSLAGSSASGQFCSQSQPHLFLEDQASLCTRCGQCSVPSSNTAGGCPFASAQDRGSFCPCARQGPSCCLRCGLCRRCTDERRDISRTAAGNGAEQPEAGFGRHRLSLSPKAIRLQLADSRRGSSTGVEQAPLARDEELTEEETAAVECRQAGLKQQQQPELMSSRAGATTTTAASTRIFGPERVLLQQQPTIKVASVSAGNFHTVVLSADNQVYTFGANTHGQLGTGDTQPRGGAHKLALSANVQVVQAVAGANHTVLRTLDGRLITFGAHKAGQLGRRRLASPADLPGTAAAVRQWFAEPGFVPGFGQAYGHLASWVSAHGDRTLVQVQRQLLSRAELADGRLTANAHWLLALAAGGTQQGRPVQTTAPTSRGYLLLRRAAEGIAAGQSAFRHFQWTTGEELAKCSFCLDPKHSDLLWAYDPHRMCVFALANCTNSSHASAVEEPRFLKLHRQMVLRSTELMPSSGVDEEPLMASAGTGLGSAGEAGSSPVRYSDCQLGLFLLCTCLSLCLATLCGKEAEETEEEEKKQGVAADGLLLEAADEQHLANGGYLQIGSAMCEAARDCQVVNRFENFGGGWGYSAHCVEAIQFKTSRDILFCGVGLFGGRGEYTAHLKLFRVLDEEVDSPGMGQQCVELLAETDEVLYECGPRETAILQLERPIRVAKGRWHVIWVQIQGPSSDCGAAGQAVVSVGDDESGGGEQQSGVQFHFRANALSNNGTNGEVGQIPELYFLTPAEQSSDDQRPTTSKRSLALHSGRKSHHPQQQRADASEGHWGAHQRGQRRRLISAASLFDVRPKELGQLLAIAEWALGGAFLEECGQLDELLDCDCVWRQERAALVVVFVLRLVRLFLCLLPLQRQGEVERLGPSEAVAFHRLLRRILERRVPDQDPVGCFLMAEAVASYVVSAHLLVPSSELLKARLVRQLVSGHQQSEHNWWLLALLASLERLSTQMILPILGLDGKDEEEERQGKPEVVKKKGNRQEQDELVEAFRRAEAEEEEPAGGQQAECSAQSIVNFLFQLAFTEVAEEGEEEEAMMSNSGLVTSGQHSKESLLLRLNSSSLRLLSILGRQLIHRCLPPSLMTAASSSMPVHPPLQSQSRFRHVSAQAQWEVGGGADSWDAIGLRVDSPGTLLRGVGLFSGIGPGQQGSVELELLQNRGVAEDWQLLERVSAPLDSFPTQSVLFARPCQLRPNISYALRVRFDTVGKTAYGEGGLPSISLGAAQQSLHFLPCAMSRNGTTVARGQFPFVLYSPASKSNHGHHQGREEEQQKLAAASSSKSALLLFLQLLRLLVQRLGQRMVHRTRTGQRLFRAGEQSLCVALLGQTNMLLECRPQLAYEVVTVLDEAIPILGHVINSSAATMASQSATTGGEDEEPQSSSSTSSSTDDRLTSRKQQRTAVGGPREAQQQMLWLESAHPYQEGQLSVQQLTFPGAQSLCLRFDGQCRTAQPSDCLWLYAVTEMDQNRKGGGRDLLYPVAKFTQNNWPSAGLAVPGNRLLLLFETGQRSAEQEAENCFGFRCSVEPMLPPAANAEPNRSLERHFNWCLANACCQLLRMENGQLEAEKEATRELLNSHALLVRRGLRHGTSGESVPSLAELVNGQWAQGKDTTTTEEHQFLEQFATGQPSQSAAAFLASALCCQPQHIHLGHSKLHFVPADGAHQLRVGMPVEIQFLGRDQHNRAVALFADEGMDVQVLLCTGSAAVDFQDSKCSSASGLLDWPALMAEQMKTSFRPVPVGRALYQCISMLPSLADHSLEELRFAFAFGQPSKERIRLVRNEKEGDGFSAIWTPRRAGHFSVKCFVDGRPLGTQPAPVEVHESVVISTGLGGPLRVQNPADIGRPVRPAATAASLRRAHLATVSHFSAVRLRVHPSLSATRVGQMPRGSSLEFVEVLRNEDGVWLRLSEASRRELLGGNSAGQHQQQRESPEASWALQFNAHLQTEYLQMTPPSNGNFIPARAESPTKKSAVPPPPAALPAVISILDSPKFRRKRRTDDASTLPGQMPALGPALAEAFRWSFCALVWHSSPDEGCQLETLMEAANWIKQRPELAERLWDVRNDQHRDIPGHLAKAMASWRQMVDGLWHTLRGKAMAQSEKSEHLQQGTEEEGHWGVAVHCELCGGSFARPIGQHMRQRHPGCGGPSLSCGYNSAGHWTTGWSGQCSEGGQGSAVWYLLCAQCRQRHLKRKSVAADDDDGCQTNANLTLAERLKRNAQFLLELNRDERLMSGQQKSRQQRGGPVLAIDPYPQAGPVKVPAEMAKGQWQQSDEKGQFDREKWHSSDPGHGHGKQQQPPFCWPQFSTTAAHHQPCSVSASAHFWPSEAAKTADQQGGPGSTGTAGPLLMSAVLAFLGAGLDLASLRQLLRQSLFRAICFAYAFRLWDWLLKMAPGLDSAPDIVWHFLSTMRQFGATSAHQQLLPHPAQLCLLAGPVPIGQMVQQFHSLLRQLAQMLQSATPGEAAGIEPGLKSLCFRAWTFQLTGHEQTLLPTIHSLLSAVGNVLSASSETATTAISNNASASDQSAASNQQQQRVGSGQVHSLDDVTSLAALEVSSRVQLVGCLLDGSCETFWESGPEDRGRERRIVVSWTTDDKLAAAKLVALFVDNGRDAGFRVARVLAMGGAKTEKGKEEAKKRPLMDAQVDKDFCGWLKFAVAGSQSRVEITLQGDETGCRVRQLRLLGIQRRQGTRREEGTPAGAPCSGSSLRPSNSQQQLFSGAQGDAFSFFQSLATQVFGDEFVAGEGNGTLREQVLDLLFSRSQLQPLQSFVGAHVSNALEREVANLRAKRKRHFSYIGALLQMLARICSTTATTMQPSAFVPDPPQLLALLSRLWLFAPKSVQLQALEVAEKLLLAAQSHPAAGQHLDVPLIVEHLLALIACSATLQVKERRHRSSSKHTFASHATDMPAEFAECQLSPEAAQAAIRLLRNVPTPWQPPFRAAVSGQVMRFSALLRDSSFNKSPADSIRCTQFWLTLASLAVMDGADWLEVGEAYQQLKAEQNRGGQPRCENHDDGRTVAQLRCQTCAVSLCRDCFSVLHLSRRNQAHKARLIGSALAPLPRADFHEGCHRLRIGQQLLVLLNPKNLAGLVELGECPEAAVIAAGLGRRSPSTDVPSSSSSMASLRKSAQQHAGGFGRPTPILDNGNGEEAAATMGECRESEEEEEAMEQSLGNVEAKCRFCGAPLGAEQLFNGVCEFEECRLKQDSACANTLRCGHWCAGIRGEAQCPPCLHCSSADNRQDADDLCSICFSERLGESPCLQLLGCLHTFHWHCLCTVLEMRWPGPRISFRFMQCPLCKAQMSHPALEQWLAPLRQLQADVEQKARLRLEYEGGQVPAGTSSNSSDQQQQQSALLETALERYMYVQCSRCQQAYFGGDVRCQNLLEEAGLAFDPTELVCGSCAAQQSGQGVSAVCGRHGAAFLEFKCCFCCSVAIYFCFGSTHFCAACHGDFQRLMALPKDALPKCPAAPRGEQLPSTEQCPLRVEHPPAGEEFALGCGICRNLSTF